jgi:hypothetical protein
MNRSVPCCGLALNMLKGPRAKKTQVPSCCPLDLHVQAMFRRHSSLTWILTLIILFHLLPIEGTSPCASSKFSGSSFFGFFGFPVDVVRLIPFPRLVGDALRLCWQQPGEIPLQGGQDPTGLGGVKGRLPASFHSRGAAMLSDHLRYPNYCSMRQVWTHFATPFQMILTCA